MSCKCQKCGKQYKIDLMISDNLWNQVKLKEKSGLLCGSCIMSRLEGIRNLGYIAFKLKKINN